MNDIKTVDARGLSCPEPVMLVSEVLRNTAKGNIEVIVDSPTALENVSRLAKNKGWEVNVENLSEGSYRIRLRK